MAPTALRKLRSSGSFTVSAFLFYLEKKTGRDEQCQMVAVISIGLRVLVVASSVWPWGVGVHGTGRGSEVTSVIPGTSLSLLRICWKVFPEGLYGHCQKMKLLIDTGEGGLLNSRFQTLPSFKIT